MLSKIAPLTMYLDYFLSKSKELLWFLKAKLIKDPDFNLIFLEQPVIPRDIYPANDMRRANDKIRRANDDDDDVRRANDDVRRADDQFQFVNILGTVDFEPTENVIEIYRQKLEERALELKKDIAAKLKFDEERAQKNNLEPLVKPRPLTEAEIAAQAEFAEDLLETAYNIAAANRIDEIEPQNRVIPLIFQNSVKNMHKNRTRPIELKQIRLFKNVLDDIKKNL